MKTLTVPLLILSVFSILLFACGTDDDSEMEDQTCYRCTYTNVTTANCDTLFVSEACVLRPHESSQQVVLEITQKCDGQTIDVSEEIRFVEDFLEEQQNAGAICDEF